jgi:hypothetical protein
MRKLCRDGGRGGISVDCDEKARRYDSSPETAAKPAEEEAEATAADMWLVGKAWLKLQSQAGVWNWGWVDLF